MNKKKSPDDGLIADNRKARFEYEIMDTLECGLDLRGSEVKSLRMKQVSFVDAFAQIEGDGQLFLHSLKIDRYRQSSVDIVEPTRKRRLLANREEIVRLQRLVREKGYTLVPLRLYFKGPWAKVLLAVARGKNNEDKRATIRAREAKRDIEREMRR
jgi:SsrA-binding protein